MATDTSGAGPAPMGDTGIQQLAASTSYRYWLFRAVSGGAVADGWDLGVLELWHNPYAGTSATAARCNHRHPAADITYDHLASGLDAGNVQDAIDELAASSRDLIDLQTGHPFVLIAHRGDMGSADSYPEGTLEAQVQAWLKGGAVPGGALADVDVRKTSDGVWVVMHDSTVTRTTSGSGSVSGMTAATFAALTIDGGYGYDSGRHGTSLHPPTLQAVIEAAIQHGGILNIESKITTAADFTSLAELVVSLHAERHVIFGIASSSTNIAAIRAVSQAIAITSDAADADVQYVVDRATTSRADVLAYAPLMVADGMLIGSYGSDETAPLTNAFDNGVRTFGTNDLDAAILILQGLIGISGGITDHGALTGLGDDDHTQYLNAARHAATDHEGIPGVGAGGIVTIDPGSYTPDDTGDDLVLTIDTVYGIDADGPYYDSGGAAAGEEAALVWDPEALVYALIAYN